MRPRWAGRRGAKRGAKELRWFHGGRFGKAPRAWRGCHLLRGGQEQIHRRGLGGLRPGREAAAPEGLGQDQAGGPGQAPRVARGAQRRAAAVGGTYGRGGGGQLARPWAVRPVSSDGPVVPGWHETVDGPDRGQTAEQAVRSGCPVGPDGAERSVVDEIPADRAQLPSPGHRHAEADDLVGRNVAALVRPPAGSEGRPSKALSVAQAQQLLRAAAGDRADGDPHRLHAYVVLLLTTGLRPEEARALRWDHVDLEVGTVAVWRSDRAGGDTKTPKSRRTLRLAQIAVAALRQRKAAQAADRLKAGEVWQDTGLVFTITIGTMFDQHNIRRGFRQITKAAGLGEDWVPRELRHTFVSIMSAGGVPVEEIARLAGHQQTSTTELVYRRELRPVITTGAEIMDRIFSETAEVGP
jgi:integrase